MRRFFGGERSAIISFITLLVIISAGLWLRLYNLSSWFNYVHDYDEGIYVVASRFITHGLMPYRDFPSPAPPLHEYFVAGMFKIFGDSFMVARYVSVFFSSINIVLMFFVAKRTLGRRAGLIAAAIFSLDPILVYTGRRAIHEPMGLTACLVGLLLLTYYLDARKRKWLVAAGIAFGLALGIKLSYIPLITGAVAAIALLEAGVNWRFLSRFGTKQALIEYLATFITLFSFIVLAKAFGFNLPLPFFDALAGTSGALIGLSVLFVPLLVVIILQSEPGTPARVYSALVRAILSVNAWILLLCTGLIFAFVMAPFILAAPSSTIREVFLDQASRPVSEIPTYLTMLRYSVVIPGVIKLYAIPVLASLPVMFFILRRRVLNTISVFVIIASAAVLFELQVTAFSYPRYYISIYPLLALGFAIIFGESAKFQGTGVSK